MITGLTDQTSNTLSARKVTVTTFVVVVYSQSLTIGIGALTNLTLAVLLFNHL